MIPSNYLLRPFTQVVLYQPPKPRVAATTQVWLPMLTDEEERNIRLLLKQPINIRFPGCSFSCSIALNELYSELNEFAQNELQINSLEVEFFGPTIWQALGSTYLAHLLSKHNFKVPQKLFPIERHQLPFYVRFCIPNTPGSASLLLALNRKCFQIIGSRLPQLDQAQALEGEAVLRYLGIPFWPQSPADFRITLAEELLARTCNSLILEFVVPPRSEVQACSYLPLNKYLSSLEKKEHFSPSPPPLHFTEGGFTVFCQNVMDWLNPATYEPNRKLLYYDSKFTPAMLVELLAQLPDEWHRQASSPEARKALLTHLEKDLAKLLQTSPLEKQTAFACFTQEIFQKPLNQHYWLEILSSPHHAELNSFACEWANTQIRNTVGQRFVQQLFIRFFTQSRRAAFAAYLCGIMGEEAAVAQLGEVLKNTKYQKKLQLLLLQLSKNKERFGRFLDSVVKAHSPLISTTCLFLCERLKVRNLPLAIEIWVKATVAGIWVSESHRKQQVELLATFSITVENKEVVEQLLRATDIMDVASAQRDQFATACAALERRSSDKGWYTKQEELLVKAYKEGSKPPLELITSSSNLIRRLSGKTFSKDLPLEAIYMAKKILVNPEIINLFFKSGEEEQWHDLLLFVAEKARKIRSEDSNTCLCSLLLKGLDQLYAAKLPYPISKRTLQRYHVFLEHFLSLQLGQRAAKNFQGNLAERLSLYLMPILTEYQSHELYEEGCQLLTRISVHKKLSHTQKFFEISCLRFLIEGLRKRVDRLAALVDVENLFEILPFLRKSSSEAKLIQKQKELCFLLAKRFLEFNEEKSWLFFERLIDCYPMVLIEPKLHHEVMDLARKLYGKKGFPVLDLLLKASQKEKSEQTTEQWRGLFVSVFDYLLVNDRFEDLYKLLKEGYHFVPCDLLENYALIWVKTVLSDRENAASQPTIGQISEMLRLYPNQITARDWVQFFQKAKNSSEIDLWQELQFADKYIINDVQERRLCWVIVLDRMKGRSLIECLEYTETLMDLFNKEVDFFIKLMWAVLKHFSREPEEYKREKGPLLSKLCSGVVSFTPEITPVQKANLGILQIESNLLMQAVPSTVQLNNLILFFKNLLTKEGITKMHFWFIGIFLHRIVQRILNQKNLSEVYNDIANNFLKVLSLLNKRDLPSYQRMDYLTELLPLVVKDHLYAPIYLMMWFSLYTKCEEEACLKINRTPRHEAARSRFFANLEQFFSSSSDLFIFPEMYRTLSLEEARLVFTARQHADLLAEISRGLLQTKGMCVEESMLANAQNIFVIGTRSSPEKVKFFYQFLFMFYIKVVKNDVSAFFKKISELSDKCKNNESIKEELANFPDFDKAFQGAAIYFLLNNLDSIPPNSQMKFIREVQNKFSDLLGQVANPRAEELWRATLVKLVLEIANCKEKGSAVIESKQFLEEMQARYQLFSQENEQELFSLYIDLFNINIHIAIPLEKFSLQTLSLKIENLIAGPGLQQKFSTEERLTAIIKLLDKSGKSLLNKVSADGDSKSLLSLKATYEALFGRLINEPSSMNQHVLLMRNHLFNLFSHISTLAEQKKQKEKGGFAHFVTKLSLHLFKLYYSKRKEKLSEYTRDVKKMPQECKRESAVLAGEFIAAVELLLPFVLEQVKNEPAEEPKFKGGLVVYFQHLLLEEHRGFYSTNPSDKKVLESRVQAIVKTAKDKGVVITLPPISTVLSSAEPLFMKDQRKKQASDEIKRLAASRASQPL